MNKGSIVERLSSDLDRKEPPRYKSPTYLTDVFLQHGLRQHVTTPTHVGGNILDLILTRDDDVNSRLVSQLSVMSVCFSDHHLLTC